MSENNQYAKNTIWKNDSMVVAVIAVLCLVLVNIFPSDDIFQEIVISLTFFLAIPVLYLKIILKRDLVDYGVKKGKVKNGILWSALSIAASLLIFYVVFNYTDFADAYYLPQRVVAEFKFFVLYEILLVGFFLVLYEFFFRGFIMFSFAKKFKAWAILIQFLAFILFLIVTDNLDWPFVPYVISAPFAGIVAYKSKSLVYSFTAGLFFVIIVDALIIGLKR